MPITTENENYMQDLIRDGIKAKVEQEFDRCFADFMKTLNERKNEIVAGIVLNMTKQVNMTMGGRIMTIEIKEIKS